MKKKIMGALLGLAFIMQPITASAYENSSEPIEVTYEEAQELMRVAWCEGGNQGTYGMLLIMSTVINRVNSSDFPDSIHDVIYQENQYATKGMQSATLTPEAHYALALLEMGELRPDIIAFETAGNDLLTRYFDTSYTYLGHTFYTLKKH